jgi:hypothetical protein
MPDHERFERYLQRHANGASPAASQPGDSCPKESAAAEEPKFTLTDAFDYFNVGDKDEPSSCAINDERCVRAVAFLLHYLSHHGNEPVAGWIAHGLAHVLEECADRFGCTEGHRQLRGENHG